MWVKFLRAGLGRIFQKFGGRESKLGRKIGRYGLNLDQNHSFFHVNHEFSNVLADAAGPWDDVGAMDSMYDFFLVNHKFSNVLAAKSGQEKKCLARGPQAAGPTRTHP